MCSSTTLSDATPTSEDGRNIWPLLYGEASTASVSL